jgi:hypothetical protein
MNVTPAQLRELVGAKPSLRAALKNITTPAASIVHHTPPLLPSNLTSTSQQAEWQQHWIHEHTPGAQGAIMGRIVLHPEVPAVRMRLQEGEWGVMDVGVARNRLDEKRVAIAGREYLVEVGREQVTPPDMSHLDTAWILVGTDAAWGHAINDVARGVLESLENSSFVPGWRSEWMSVEPAKLAAMLVFGPYVPRVSTYDEAVADAAPDDGIVSLAVDMVDADVVVLGFGTNFPSTRNPMTRAGRTS